MALTQREICLLAVIYMRILELNNQCARVTLILQCLLRKRRLIKQRQVMLNTVAALLLNKPNRMRTLWEFPKNQSWWTEIVPSFTSWQWKEHFRVSQTTYEYLVETLRSQLQRQNTNFRKCITVRKRIAMSLYMLSSSAELRTVAQLFGVGKSTLCESLHEFCSCVVETFLTRTISIPKTEEEISNLIKGFENVCQFPQCIGAIDGTHIAVSPPKENAVDYYNYKCFYSTVLLAVCDSAYKFWYISVGSPGRNNDAHIFRNSKLFPILEKPSISFQNLCKTIQGVNVPPLILGDSAFPLQVNLMKPYPESRSLNEKQNRYNYCQARARRVIENAFGRLKARFRIIAKRNEFEIENVPRIIQTCCILHNLCEEKADFPETQWLENITEQNENITSTIGSNDNRSRAVRDALSDYFCSVMPEM